MKEIKVISLEDYKLAYLDTPSPQKNSANKTAKTIED